MDGPAPLFRLIVSPIMAEKHPKRPRDLNLDREGGLLLIRRLGSPTFADAYRARVGHESEFCVDVSINLLISLARPRGIEPLFSPATFRRAELTRQCQRGIDRLKAKAAHKVLAVTEVG